MGTPSPLTISLPANDTVQLAVGNQASSVTFINYDPVNTIYLGYQANLTPVAANTIPLQPGDSITLPGNFTIWGVSAVAAGPVTAAAGGASYSTGTVNISGPVSATISGTVDVDVQNAVLDANITNATIDIVGQGGFILGGELALLSQNASVITVPPLGTANVGSFNVSNYSSLLFFSDAPTLTGPTSSSALCIVYHFQWEDSNGNIIGNDVVSQILGSEMTIQVPIKSSNVFIYAANPGSSGNITLAVNSAYVWGDYRTVSKISVNNYVAGVLSISGWTTLQSVQPVGSVPSWIAALDETAEAGATSYILPLSLWYGSVSGYYQQVTEALNNDAVIVDITYATPGTLTAGTAYIYGVLQNLPLAIQASPVNINFNAPPTQLALLFKTATAGGATMLYLSGLS